MSLQLGIHGRGFPEGGITALQRLVETALELCRAHSVGVSILENENESESEIFRWRAAAGQWAVHRDEVMSRDSLCGIVVDRNAALLITCPDGQSKYTRNIALPIAEALLIPFHLGGEPIGVIWIISHEATRRFDTEDRRLITSLARFAGIAIT